jgi:hypothetical protein
MAKQTELPEEVAKLLNEIAGEMGATVAKALGRAYQLGKIDGAKELSESVIKSFAKASR